jgi:hypothetical protein
MLMKRVLFLTFLFYFHSTLFATSSTNISINVGIYDNEPKIFFDQNGIASGIYVDILEEIKKSEHWNINYKN